MAQTITLPQAQQITEVVKKVLENGFSTDKTLQFHFKNNKVTEEFDRAIIAELTYEVIRWWRLLLEIHNEFPITKEIDYYKILGTWLVLHNWDVPIGNSFRGVKKDEILNQFSALSSIRKIRQSVPDWLDMEGYSSHFDDWENEIKALNQIPPIYLRANRLKIKPVELSAILKKEGFDNALVDKAPDALKLLNRVNVFSSKYYKDGYFEVQDAGSQQISMFLDARPGMRVADACAGNGGKTLHISCLMQNRGKIIALDTQEGKLKTLRSRVSKAGVDIVETKFIKNSKTIKRYEASFDRLLLDVPCSGTGAMKRNPEIKWNMSPDRLKKLQKIQADLLYRYSDMVKPGGQMVYATCSILKSENQDQVQTFLEKKQNQFELIKENIILPSSGFDGFYMALIARR